MENFTYNYSAKGRSEIERIRENYLPKEESKLERLRRLDRRAKRAGIIESLCLGIIGALIFGVGMCFFLGVFAGHWIICAALMLLGAGVMIPAYHVCKKISKRTNLKLAPKILRLTEELLEER